MDDETVRSNFEFFNKLSGNLEIELTEPPGPYKNMANLTAMPGAKIVDVRLHLEVFKADDTEQFHDLSEAELQLVILCRPSIRLRGEGGVVVEHKAPNGKSFTIQDMISAIETTERKSRGNSAWLGGIDVHHIFFEGIFEDEDGVWGINWGS